MAQSNVYSLNVVGYYNVPIAASTLYVVANQLNTTNNTVPYVLPPVDGMQVQKYSGSWSAYTYDSSIPDWTPSANGVTLNPGEGAFLRSPVATTLTFVGEVMQGVLSNSLPKGTYVIRNSMVPQTGGITADLGLVPADGDTIQVWATPNPGWNAYTYDSSIPGYTPGTGDVTVNIGTAFFFRRSPTATDESWIRNFTVQ